VDGCNQGGFVALSRGTFGSDVNRGAPGMLSIAYALFEESVDGW